MYGEVAGHDEFIRLPVRNRKSIGLGKIDDERTDGRMPLNRFGAGKHKDCIFGVCAEVGFSSRNRIGRRGEIGEHFVESGADSLPVPVERSRGAGEGGRTDV